MTIKHDRKLGPVGRSAYVKGCRCKGCKNSNTEYLAEYRANRRAESHHSEPAREPREPRRTVGPRTPENPVAASWEPASEPYAASPREPASESVWSAEWTCDNCGHVNQIFEVEIFTTQRCEHCLHLDVASFYQQMIDLRMPGWIDESIETPVGNIQTNYQRQLAAARRHEAMTKKWIEE